MKKKYLAIVMIFVLSLLACSSQPIRLIPLPQFDDIDSTLTKDGKYKMKYSKYIVENFRESEETEKTIDSMVRAVIVKDFSKYETYNIGIYKASNTTNVEYLKQNPRDFIRISRDNDWIYDYIWLDGKFAGKMKVIDGKLMPSN
jgi:major membrane immunogen (membrane-anchored lipoprotein)